MKGRLGMSYLRKTKGRQSLWEMHSIPSYILLEEGYDLPSGFGVVSMT